MKQQKIFFGITVVLLLTVVAVILFVPRKLKVNTDGTIVIPSITDPSNTLAATTPAPDETTSDN